MQGKEDDGVRGGGGGGGGGATGAPIDMSLSHLREFFFSLGLKCHSETILQLGVSSLAEANVQ